MLTSNFTVLASWKDQNNDFKKNLKLTGVPTLLRYGTVKISKCPLTNEFNTSTLYASCKCTMLVCFKPQKLVEEECFKADLVRMMFTED